MSIMHVLLIMHRYYVLIDRGCVSDDECGEYTEGIAELIASMKPRSAPRIGALTYDGYGSEIIIALKDTQYNDFTGPASSWY